MNPIPIPFRKQCSEIAIDGVIRRQKPRRGYGGPGEWVLPSSDGGTEPRAGNGASRGLPSTLGSLVRRELLLGAESLLMVSGGLLLSTTGYVGLSANSTRIQKINKKSINSIFNFLKNIRRGIQSSEPMTGANHPGGGVRN